MEKKKMDEIINDTLELKKIIEESKEYKDYIELTKKLDKNKKINNIINEIKSRQKKIVNMEVKKEDTSLEEEKLNFLFDQLNSIDEYKAYIKASRKLNKLITNVQNNFTKSFNEILD